LPEISNPNLQTQGPGGGSGSGGDMRSTLAFTLLILVVFLGYQYFFKPTPPAAPPAAQTASQVEPPAAPTAAGQTAPQQLAAAQAQSSTPVIAAPLEATTTVENEKYRIVFTNRGAQVKQWILKNYSDTAGKPLDMVQPQVAAQFGYPLSLFTYDPALTTQLNQALYQVSVSGAPPAPAGNPGLVLAPGSLTFHYAANGIEVIKTFRFDSSYVVGVDTEVTRNGVPVRALVQWPAGLGDMEEFLPSSSTRSPVRTSVSSQFAWSLNGKDDSMSAAKVSGNATFDLPYSYAAVSDLYFAAAFLPDAPDRVSLVTLHHSVDLPSDLSDPNSKKRPADIIGLAMGDTSGVTRLRLFAGPKDTDVLNSIRASGPDGKPSGQSLESLIRFGWLTIIAKPLYLALRFLRGLLGPGINNWGWAIIIVTVVINMLMLPTRIMMMRSSLKMMRIQPKVEALKKRYAHLKMNDPKKAEMNTEMMALYRTEGVNMYGGCLPMLIQMPLLYAIYRVLANAVELREAHWFWLTDLSSPDPLHILPILIIITMFLVQFITPSPGMDPNQRRMMAIFMPIVFGFSMLHFASGLALYWGTGNLINLAIQVGINQSSIGKEMHEIAARRAAKKSGVNPKTIQGKR
jgi:YidC/Oxa1 family membrane protein insertase